MAQLGDGSGSGYPAAVDTAQTYANVAAPIADDDRRIDAELLNDILDTLKKLETALGVNPQGASADVGARIGALNQAAIADLKTTDSPVFVTAKLSALTDDYIPYHVNDATGLANGPTKTNVDSAVSLKHAAVTVSAPISASTQALSLVNDVAATVTEIDTGALANLDTVVPTSKSVTTAIAIVGNIVTRSRFEKGFGEQLMPADGFTSMNLGGLFDEDSLGDLMPSAGTTIDTFYEVDGSDNLMPMAV